MASSGHATPFFSRRSNQTLNMVENRSLPLPPSYNSQAYSTHPAPEPTPSHACINIVRFFYRYRRAAAGATSGSDDDDASTRMAATPWTSRCARILAFRTRWRSATTTKLPALQQEGGTEGGMEGPLCRTVHAGQERGFIRLGRESRLHDRAGPLRPLMPLRALTSRPRLNGTVIDRSIAKYGLFLTLKLS